MNMLIACLAVAADAPAPEYYRGTLALNLFQDRTLFLEIRPAERGVRPLALDSVEISAMGIPGTAATFGADGWKLAFPKIAATFDGQPDAKGRIAGTWTEKGQARKASFAKVDRRRPQEPLPPFPYRTEEVAVLNAAETPAVKLAGTLTLPAGPGPHPAAVLVTGSGPQDRDEAIFGHRPFWVLADCLARHGIATLRLDDRGVGGSDKGKADPNSADFAGDAWAAAEWLRTRPEIAKDRIGLIGHSEGGMIGPMVAAAHPDGVAFLVLLAGTGVSGEDILLRQSRDILGAASIAAAEANNKLQKQLFEIVKREPDRKKAVEPLRAALKAGGIATPAILDAQVAAVNGAWMRYFIAHDPRPDLQRVRCPTLALNGAKDLQVAAAVNLPAIKQALAAGPCRDAETVELPALNHLFQTCKTGGIDEYPKLEETFAPAALERISAWIAKRFVAASRH